MDSNTPRRTFLTGLAAPLILGTTNKSGSKKPILGEGEHTYEVTHNWGELPADIKYGNTHGVCEDSHGHIYIHHTVYSTSEKPDSIVVFDHKGKFVKSWGKEFKGNKQFRFTILQHLPANPVLICGSLFLAIPKEKRYWRDK